MLNYIWIGMVLVAVVVGALNGRIEDVSNAVIAKSRSAVMDLALPMGGMFVLMLGLMRVVEKSGLIAALARMFRPLLRLLFPDVPPEHPAMGAMMMNIAANLLGASNAATPFGLRAMTELEKINPHPGTASNAMCTFLVMNTSALTLVSTSALILLKQYNSTNPSAVVAPTILATITGLVLGLVMVRIFERLPVFAVREAAAVEAGPKADADAMPPTIEPPRFGTWHGVVLGLYGVVLAAAFGILMRRTSGSGGISLQSVLSAISPLVLPGFIGFCVLYAALARLKVFDEFVEGAKEGMQTVFRIIPYLVGMLVAIGLLQASGVIDLLTNALKHPLSWIGFPQELLPMALMRPLSGSGSQSVLASILEQYGGDHLLSRTAATMYGSAETTFYVLAVYFGAVNVRRIRHALVAGLIADAVAMGTAVVICRMMFG